MNKVLFSVLLLLSVCAALFAQQEDRIFIPDRKSDVKLMQQETVLAAPQFELEPITPAEDLEPSLIRQAQRNDKHLITGQDAQLKPATPAPIPTLQLTKQVRWEYLVALREQADEQEFLDIHGNLGWELILVTDQRSVFKRPKP